MDKDAMDLNEQRSRNEIQGIPIWVWVGVPYILIGSLALIGMLSKELQNSPYAKQTDVDKLALIVTNDHDKLDTAIDQLANIAKIVDKMNDRQDELDKVGQDNSVHIEGLQADQKADDSETISRRHK